MMLNILLKKKRKKMMKNQKEKIRNLKVIKISIAIKKNKKKLNMKKLVIYLMILQLVDQMKIEKVLIIRNIRKVKENNIKSIMIRIKIILIIIIIINKREEKIRITR
jgi:hypothetical protein